MPTETASSSSAETGGGPSDPAPSAGVPSALEIQASATATAPPAPSPSGRSSSMSGDLGKLRLKMEAAASQDRLTEIADLVRKSDDIFTKRFAELEDFVVQLNPSFLGAAVIGVLKFMFDFHASKNNEEGMIRTCEHLKRIMDERQLVRAQILTVIDIYVALLRRVTDLLIKKEQFNSGVFMMQAAIDIVTDRADGVVSSLHTCLFILALKSHEIAHGFEFVHDYIRGLLPENVPVPAHQQPPAPDSRALLSYLYYAALIVARMGDWKRSANFLRQCVSLPGNSVSEIQIEALKKLHIISLIDDPSAQISPQRSASLGRHWKGCGGVYTQLASAVTDRRIRDEDDHTALPAEDEKKASFASNKAEAAEKILRLQEKAFEKDKNADLVRILIHELKLKAVLRVAQLFSVVSLKRATDFAHLQDVAQCKQFMAELVEARRLEMTEDGPEFVRLAIPFHPVPTGLIEAKQTSLRQMTDDIGKADIACQMNPFYLSKQIRSSQVGGHYGNDDEGLSMPSAAAASSSSSRPENGMDIENMRP